MKPTLTSYCDGCGVQMQGVDRLNVQLRYLMHRGKDCVYYGKPLGSKPRQSWAAQYKERRWQALLARKEDVQRTDLTLACEGCDKPMHQTAPDTYTWDCKCPHPFDFYTDFCSMLPVYPQVLEVGR